MVEIIPPLLTPGYQCGFAEGGAGKRFEVVYPHIVFPGYR